MFCRAVYRRDRYYDTLPLKDGIGELSKRDQRRRGFRVIAIFWPFRFDIGERLDAKALPADDADELVAFLST